LETAVNTITYENIYYTLWETAKRYRTFTQFRVIGKSHDDRLIPMLEIGEGAEALFCLAGLSGTDREMPRYLMELAGMYCRYYECGWEMEHLYVVKSLLSEIRICLIPLVNPDGYEIGCRGYQAIRNPIHRQMLKMQNLPAENYTGNARGIKLSDNFPIEGWNRRKIHQQPASENETKALIRIFQEVESVALLSFSSAQNGNLSGWYPGHFPAKRRVRQPSLEACFTGMKAKPAFHIRTETDIRTLPLEFIFTLVS
jgi:g-D-glutamyl-meso-diaminopimelate peptidase